MRTGTKTIRVGWMMLGLALVPATMEPVLAASETQVRFRLAQPFRVGEHAYDAGVIAVHSVSPYTPTTSILEVWVNGDCLGMMTATRSASEEPPLRTEALFLREGDGRLVMIGFRMTGHPTVTTYRFHIRRGSSVPESAAAVALAR